MLVGVSIAALLLALGYVSLKAYRLSKALDSTTDALVDAMAHDVNVTDPGKVGVYVEGKYIGTTRDLADFYMERQRAMGSIGTKYGAN